ncbi:hypothetical protein [Natronomonas sp.]|uniref:hypothetical protein n=1 Tax=Natronomonas sp. TaxID=2184060 RepID=UPI0039752A43
MSEYSTPVSVAFEFQRSTIQSAHEVVENGIEAQKQFNAAMVDGFGPARDASERNTDLVRTGVDTYFDAIEAVVPAGSGVDEVREITHEQLNLFEESQLDAIDQLEGGFDESTQTTDEMLDEFLSALNEQVTTLLNAHEDLEGQTIEMLERLEDGIEDLQAEFEARGEEMQEQLEAQAEAIQEQLEDVTENVQEAASETTELSA